MLKVLVKLLLRPELLTMHVQGYADLFSEESSTLMRWLRNRWLAGALGIASLLLAIQWAGMALLLWSVLPVVDPRWAWVLWAWPLAWALLALVFGVIFKMLGRPVFFPRIREQIQLDVIALRQTRQA